MQFLKVTSLPFLVDLNLKEKLLVYPDVVKSFYHTFKAISNDKTMYEVKITRIKVSFTITKLCFSLGFLVEYANNTGLGPLFMSLLIK